jgi:GNAT superfamily N-acetyltransferase
MKIAEVLAHTEEDDRDLTAQMYASFNRKLASLKAVTTIGQTHVFASRWPPAFYTIFYFLQEDDLIGWAILRRGGRAAENDGNVDWFAVTLIYLLEPYRRQGLGMAFYRFLQSQGIKLQPDTKQTAAGEGVWTALRREPLGGVPGGV